MLRRRGGRPPIGSAAASVESVRLDPELQQALRAERDHETTYSVIRKALRKALCANCASEGGVTRGAAQRPSAPS